MEKSALAHNEDCRVSWRYREEVRTLYTRVASGEYGKRKYSWKPVGHFCTRCEATQMDIEVLKNVG